jgi:hypothetical protein
MSDVKILEENVLGGGTIEMFKLEGFFYVKSIVSGVVKFSEAVRKVDANYFVFDARHYGNLDF